MNSRNTHKPIESDEEWGEIAQKGTAHEQSQNTTNGSTQHRQQPAARAYIITIRHKVHRNPAPRRDTRLRLQDEQSKHPQTDRKRRGVGGHRTKRRTARTTTKHNEQNHAAPTTTSSAGTYDDHPGSASDARAAAHSNPLTSAARASASLARAFALAVCASARSTRT